MGRIEEARKILGDNYVIVPLSSWNHDVDEHKKLLSRLQIAQEALEKIKAGDILDVIWNKGTALDSCQHIAREALEQIRRD